MCTDFCNNEINIFTIIVIVNLSSFSCTIFLAMYPIIIINTFSFVICHVLEVQSCHTQLDSEVECVSCGSGKLIQRSMTPLLND